MLREFPTLNPGASINQRTKLLCMDNIGGGFPGTIRMRNLMTCTWAIWTINTMDGNKKNRGIYKPKKFRSHSTRDNGNSNGDSGSGKPPNIYSHTQSELCTDCGMPQAEIKYQLYSLTSQTRWTGWGTTKKVITYDQLFHSPSTIDPLLNVLKRTRLNKIYISTRKSSLPEVIFSPRKINIIGHLLLDYIVDSPV